MSIEAAIQKAIPGLRTSGSPVDRIAYARDLWPRHHIAVLGGKVPEKRPDIVVWPSSPEEVSAVVRFCANEGVPMVPFGAGSGVCGGISPDSRTVVLDLKPLKAIRALDPELGALDVEAGALGVRLEEDLNALGFTLGHFPSSILCSTVGGWIAGRSAGQCSGKYGKIEDMVASLECVIGKGDLIRFERRTEGPDITPLIIGSEGIFGVVTAARLRLHPLPPARALEGLSFPEIEAGWSAMREMFQSGLRPAVARLYDPFDSMVARMGSVRKKGKSHEETPRADDGSKKPKGGPGASAIALRTLLRMPSALNRLIDMAPSRVFGGSTLILIFEGKEAEARGDLARAKTIAAKYGARSLGEEPARHWLSHRYSVSYRQAPMFMAGTFGDTMEVAAPWSRLDTLYRNVREALGRRVFVMAHLSHAYPDGCSIYFTFAGSAPTPQAMQELYDTVWRDAPDAAIAAGGTISHHHGVGRSKAPKMGAELGLGVDVVRALAGVFDPGGIMNPGNLIPHGPASRRPAAPPPASPVLDHESLLVHAAGSATLGQIEEFLAHRGLSLALGPNAPPLSTPIAAWIAEGGRGAPDPYADPVDHLLAGFTARLPSGAELEVRPSPRRAVGPDLFALFLGTRNRMGTIESAWLRVHGKERARAMDTGIARNPPVSDAEKNWLERIAGAVVKVG